MTSLQSKTALAALAMISLTTIAGCASAAPAPTDDAEAPTTSGEYADGTYTATGEYQAPSGSESIEVTLTLAGNSITEVEVVGDASDAQAKQFQSQFSDGIGDLVVGKNIDEIAVDKVGGSSLTSGGFDDAIATIKADAAV